MLIDDQAKAQEVVDKLQALHDGIIEAWNEASNDGDYDRAKDLKVQSDRAGDQLIEARQYLLSSFDGGKDVTALLAQLAGLQTAIEAEQANVEAGSETCKEIATVLDTVAQAISTGKSLLGG